MEKWKVITLGITFALSARAAAPPQLTNLTNAQVDAAISTFAAALAFRAVEPASTYGKAWGFSLGVIGRSTSTSLLKKELPITDINRVYGAHFFLGLQFPLGLGVELGMLPTVTVTNASLSSYGGALKWTFSNALGWVAGPDLAARFHVTSSKFSYSQVVSGVNDSASYSSTVSGLSLSASYRLLILEPYAGVGVLRQNATLSNTGSVQLFDQTVSLTSSLDRSLTTAWFYAGAQLKLLALTLSAEVDRMFGITSASGKVALKF